MSQVGFGIIGGGMIGPYHASAIQMIHEATNNSNKFPPIYFL